MASEEIYRCRGEKEVLEKEDEEEAEERDREEALETRKRSRGVSSPLLLLSGRAGGSVASCRLTHTSC